MRATGLCLLLTVLVTMSVPALAGPPYVTDDPEPTDLHHYEIFAFDLGTTKRGDTSGAAGIDFNYGAAPDLQLNVTLPLEYDHPFDQPHAAAIGNIELAAKYRFLHQDGFGLDVSIYPRVFLPSTSHSIGDDHAALFVPLWVEKDIGSWSTFGGGGCTLNRGGDSEDYCLVGWALTKEVLPKLRLGGEIYHQTPDTHGGRALTGLAAGVQYDLTEVLHLMGSFGPGLQNISQTGRYSWYAALQFTF